VNQFAAESKSNSDRGRPFAEWSVQSSNDNTNPVSARPGARPQFSPGSQVRNTESGGGVGLFARVNFGASGTQSKSQKWTQVETAVRLSDGSFSLNFSFGRSNQSEIRMRSMPKTHDDDSDER
jgi:hypothetical protein